MCVAAAAHSAPSPRATSREIDRSAEWGLGLEAAIDDDQRCDEQHPADQQRPLTDKSPPLAEVGTNDECAEHAQDRQYDDAEDMGTADFCCRDLRASGEAKADTEKDRREGVHQTADDQAHAQAGRRGVEDAPRRYLTPGGWGC